MGKYLVEARSVVKKYKGTHNVRLEVLKGISLSINKGEIIAVVGPSGAGKSTLLHILGGLDHPDEGEVLYSGTGISKFRQEELARFRNKEIGFVFQFHHLLPEFTAMENVFMPMLIAGVPISECKKRAVELLKTVGLEERIQHYPSELSGGENQRVAVARALINHPKVLFADEPTGNLDRKGALQLHDLLWNFNKNTGIALFIVTHNEELSKRADRIIHLIDGKIKGDV